MYDRFAVTASRPLTPAERAFAYTVFRDGVRYDAVSISDIGIAGQVITTHFNGAFTIRWSPGFRDIVREERYKAIFIHEMTHLWQAATTAAGPAHTSQVGNRAGASPTIPPG